MIQNIDALCTHILQNHFYFCIELKNTMSISYLFFFWRFLLLLVFCCWFFCILTVSKNLKVLRFFGGKLIMIMNFYFLYFVWFCISSTSKIWKSRIFFNWLWCRLLDEVNVWGNVIQSILILQNGTMEFYSPCDIIFTTPLPSLSLENAVWFLLQLPMVSLA